MRDGRSDASRAACVVDICGRSPEARSQRMDDEEGDAPSAHTGHSDASGLACVRRWTGMWPEARSQWNG